MKECYLKVIMVLSCTSVLFACGGFGLGGQDYSYNVGTGYILSSVSLLRK